MKYPVYLPNLSGNEKKYVNECLDSTWISSKGIFVEQFEEGFANYLGVRHAVGVSNGTVALHVALLALGIGPGDEVIVPTLTYIASVNAIAYTGAKPVFVDSLEESWQMDPKDVKNKISNKTKAIMAVHLYGHPCDMTKIMEISKEHDLYVVEDAAEALGSLYQGKKVGSIGHISTFSFYGNKTITTGEGGMVVTNDSDLHQKVVHLKGQGLARDREYWHDVIGYNYRMTNICAAIGLAQLDRIESTIKRKVEIANHYEKAFEGTDITFHHALNDVYHSYWMCSILIKNAEDRDQLRDHLRNNEIETRPLFYPIHQMPMYCEGQGKFLVAENLGSRGLNLPSYPDLTDEDIEFIANIVLRWKIV